MAPVVVVAVGVVVVERGNAEVRRWGVGLSEEEVCKGAASHPLANTTCTHLTRMPHTHTHTRPAPIQHVHRHDHPLGNLIHAHLSFASTSRLPVSAF